MAEKDDRVDWIEERCVVALKSKADKFRKLLGTEEGELVKRFLDNDDPVKIFFIDGAKEISVCAVPPVATKKKVFYLLKTADAKISPKDIGSQIVCGDLPPTLLENFWAVLEGVYLPVLSNPKNQLVRCGPL